MAPGRDQAKLSESSGEDDKHDHHTQAPASTSSTGTTAPARVLSSSSSLTPSLRPTITIEAIVTTTINCLAAIEFVQSPPYCSKPYIPSPPGRKAERRHLDVLRLIAALRQLGPATDSRLWIGTIFAELVESALCGWGCTHEASMKLFLVRAVSKPTEEKPTP